MKKLFANKKTRYRNLVLVLLPLVFLLFVSGFIAVDAVRKTVLGTTNEAKKSYLDIDTMDYHLRNDATQLQKDLFRELKDATEKEPLDNLAVATLVAQNFVADFFTWTNKSGQADIGGLYYVYSPQKKLIFQQARDSFYHYLSTYMDRYGAANLLEVETVKADGKEIAESERYTLDGVAYPSYSVTVDWTYKASASFNEEDYIKRAHFTIIRNADNRFEIVQGYGDE